MKKPFLVVLLTALSTACHTRKPPSDLRITNPIAAKSLFPEVVLIIGKPVSGNKTACVGTFVTPRLILTAAHCLFDSDGLPLSELSYRAPDDTVHLATMYPDPNFRFADNIDEAMKRDLALLEFNSDIAPAIAKISKDAVSIGDSISIVGYGRSKIGSAESLTKNYGRNEVFSIDANLSYLRGYAKAPPRAVSAGSLSSSEHGDSGGAMFNTKGELAGVISGGAVSKIRPELAESYIVNISHRDSVDSISRIVGNVCNKKSMNR